MPAVKTTDSVNPQTHTPDFKKWFGDWEKAQRIEKLKNSKAIIAPKNPHKGKYVLNRDSAQKYMKDNLRGKYTIKDTRENVEVTLVGVKKVTAYNQGKTEHLKSIALVPEIIENSIYITEEKTEKSNKKYDSYRYYVTGLKLGDVDYTVKIVVGVKNGKKYYDHRLTQLEKGKLINSLNWLTKPVATNELSKFKDNRLIDILQVNSSKVVDASGKPLVVYHGTDARFNTFKPNFATGWGEGIYFTDNKAQAAEFGENIVSAFLSLKNPFIENWTNLKDEDVEATNAYKILNEKHKEDYGEDLYWPDEWAEDSKFVGNLLRELGFDGVIAENSNGIDGKEIIAFSPTQIKSATANNGNFSMENNSILEGVKQNQSPAFKAPSQIKVLIGKLEGLGGIKAELSHNKLQNGIEIKFSEKPEYNVIAQIKSLGYRWSRRNNVWYKKYSQYLWERTEKYLNETFGHDAQSEPKSESPKPQQPKEPAIPSPDDFIRNEKDAHHIATTPIAEWIVSKMPSELHIDGRTYIHNEKKGLYEHLPPKRKRTDKYSYADINTLAVRLALKNGLVFPMENYKLNRAHFGSEFKSLFSFDNMVKKYPVLKNAPDYSQQREKIEQRETKNKAEDAKWVKWKTEHLEKNATLYNYNKETEKYAPVTIEHPEKSYGSYDYYGRFDIAEVVDKSISYIHFVNTVPLDNLYLENPDVNPQAKPITEIWPIEGHEPKPATKPKEKPEPRHELKIHKHLMAFLQANGKNLMLDDTDEIAALISKNFKRDQLPTVSNFPTKKDDCIDKLLQRSIYREAQNHEPHEISLFAYATGQFISEAHTEAAILTEALYIPEKEYRTRHKKAIEQALEEGKAVPAEVLKDYPELQSRQPKLEKEQPKADKPQNVTVKTRVDRLTASVYDLIADYKYQGLDNKTAWSKFIIDRDLKPGMDAIDFYNIWKTVAPKALTSHSDQVKFNPTHYDEFHKMYVQNTDKGIYTEHLWEDGSTGSTPNKYIDPLRFISLKEAANSRATADTPSPDKDDLKNPNSFTYEDYCHVEHSQSPVPDSKNKAAARLKLKMKMLKLKLQMQND